MLTKQQQDELKFYLERGNDYTVKGIHKKTEIPESTIYRKRAEYRQQQQMTALVQNNQELKRENKKLKKETQQQQLVNSKLDTLIEMNKNLNSTTPAQETARPKLRLAKK